MPDVIILPEGGTHDESNETRIELLETWSDETTDYLGKQFAGIANVLDYGAAGDGVTDDFAAIEAAIAAATAGDILYVPPATYSLSDDITLSKALTVLAYGATFDGGGFYVTAADCTIEGGTFVNGANASVRTALGGLTVRNCTITNDAASGIEINVNGAATITDCVIEGNTIDLTGATAATTTAKGISLVGDLGDGPLIRRTRIIGNRVRLVEEPTNGAAICIEAWNGCPYTVIADNHTEGGYMGISAADCDYSTISGNVVRRADYAALECANTSYSTWQGNTVDGDSLTQNGFSITTNKTIDGYGSFVGNTLDGVTNAGVFLYNHDNANVQGNSIIAAGHGLYIQSSNFIAVTGNTLVGTGGATNGVAIDTSDGIAVTGNIMHNLTANGVLVYATTAFAFNALWVIGNAMDAVAVPYATSLSGGASVSASSHITTGYNGGTYTVTNVSTDRAYDANATTTDELADVLGTLIADLRSAGIVQ